MIISFIIVTSLFFGLYDLKYEYFEENKAERLVDYIGLIAYILILLFFIVTGIYISVKKNNFKPLEFLKEVGLTIFLITWFHVGFTTPVLSGVILFLNSNIGKQNEIMIEGQVTHKWINSFKCYSTRELTVLTDSDITYVFDVDRLEIKKYDIDSIFNKTMKVGCFGLVYK